MQHSDNEYTSRIISTLTERLERELEHHELSIFSIERSDKAYEAIIDFISDPSITKSELEGYITGMLNNF